jgi:hypothetical protein
MNKPHMNVRRSNATRRAFERKVEILEEWARNGGAPANRWLPSGPVEVARWEDAELGISAWRSPNVAAPNGRHADLRRRFDEAMMELHRISVRPDRTTIARLAADNRRLKRENIALAEQIVEIHLRSVQLEQAIARERQLKEEATQRENAIIAERAKVVPMYPVSR